jgi:hypothetical protein
MADIRIDVYHHFDSVWSEAPPWAVELKTMVSGLITQESEQMATLADIVTETRNTRTIVGSVKVAFDGLQAKVTELTAALDAAIASNDPVAMQAAVDELKAVNAELQTLAPAITDNVAVPPGG